MSADRRSIKMGEGYVALGTDSSALEKGLDAAKKKIEAWGKSLIAWGTSIAAVGTAIMAPFFVAIEHFAGWGHEMTVGMRELGVSFEDLGQLMNGMRVNLEQLTPSIAHMSAALAAAAGGSAESIGHLTALGLTLDELNRMSQGERMMAFAEALSRVADAGQRIALQRAIFGRGSLAMNIEGGAAGIRARALRADEIEGVQTPAMLAAAQAYNAAIREMKLAFGGLWLTIANAVAPSMARFVAILTGAIVRVRHFAETHHDLITALFYFGGLLVTIGGTLTALGSTVWIVEAAFGVLKHVIISVSGAFILARIAFAMTGMQSLVYATYALQIALKVLPPLIILVTEGFYIATAATMAWSVACGIATGLHWLMTTAILAMEVVLWPLTAVLTVLQAAYQIATLGLVGWWVASQSATMAAIGNAIATAFLTVTVWAYNAAVVVANVLTWAWEVALGALILALVAIVAVGIYFAVSWLASLEIVQTAFQLWWQGVAVIFEAIMSAVGPMVDLWVQGMGYIGTAFAYVFDAMGEWWISTLVPAASRAGTMLSNLFSETFQRIGHLFHDLVGTASQSWGGIQNAFMAGDMTLVWEILKAGAILAWAQITGEFELMLIDWEYAMYGVWNTITDFLEDTFSDSWAFLKGGFWELAAVIIEAFASVHTYVSQMLNSIFGALGETISARLGFTALGAGLAGAAAGARNMATATGAGRELDRERERRERAQRDAGLVEEGAAAAVAAMTESGVAIADADRLLQNLTRDAEMLAYLADNEARMGMPTFAPGTDLIGERGSVVGGFNNQALMGALGASGGESPAARQARLAQTQIDLMREFIAQAKEIARVAGARVS